MTIFQTDRQLLLQFVAEHGPKFHGFVLDVGGGGGRYSRLFRHVKRYAILDADAAKKPNIVATVEKIPLDDESVDGIICTQVLGDVFDVQKAADEMMRVLKPGGLLLVTESWVADLHDEPHDYWRFSGEALTRLFGAGCDVLIVEPRGGYHSLQCQQSIRYLIDRFDLYRRPLLGRIVNCYALATGHLALYRDRKGRDRNNGEFTIGYNLLAKKKG
jgi:SAM-dependent methyltransferase